MPQDGGQAILPRQPMDLATLILSAIFSRPVKRLIARALPDLVFVK